MANVFVDLSADAMSRVSTNHYFDSFTCYSDVPDVEVYEGEDMIRVVSPGIPNWLTNTVLRCRLSADNVDTVIDETNEYFYSRGVLPYWRLCPGDLPSDLGERLVKNGLSLVEEQPAMAADLQKLNQNIQMPDDFIVERVTDAATMKEKHGWIRQFAVGKSLGTLVMDLFTAYGFHPDFGLATLHRRSAWEACSLGIGVLHYGGCRNLCGRHTVRKRRQGIGSAITLHALLDARERGYRVGVLQSSEMGYNMYLRLGFATCFKIKTNVRTVSQT